MGKYLLVSPENYKKRINTIRGYNAGSGNVKVGGFSGLHIATYISNDYRYKSLHYNLFYVQIYLTSKS